MKNDEETKNGMMTAYGQEFMMNEDVASALKVLQEDDGAAVKNMLAKRAADGGGYETTVIRTYKRRHA